MNLQNSSLRQDQFLSFCASILLYMLPGGLTQSAVHSLFLLCSLLSGENTKSHTS